MILIRNKLLADNVKIQVQLDRMGSKGNKDTLPPGKSQRLKAVPDFDVRDELYRMTDVDLTWIDGLNETSVLKILAEAGISTLTLAI